MANIRIAQQLTQGYNPDGTPGTVTTGLPGPAGPPPTDDQVVAAVGMYLQMHGGAGSMGSMGMAGIDTAPLTKHGVGADGSTGAWVGVGDNSSTVSGYVVAGGSLPDVDLHITPKGAGKIYLDGPVAALTLTDELIVPGDLHVGRQLVFDDAITGGLTAATARVGNSSFDNGSGQGFLISNDWVSISPYGGQGNPVGIDILDIVAGTHATIRASAFTVSSDRKLKSDIVELSGALEEVRTTPAYRYVMAGQRRRGLIADEAPAEITRTGGQFSMIDLYDMVGTLWAALRELIEGMEQTCRCQPTA